MSLQTLERSLIDHPAALLRVIADLRGIALSAREHPLLAAELANALADPVVIAVGLEELSTGALEALAALAAQDGRLPASQFQRQFGEIRPFGPGRLAREQPWQAVTGPAEELWYRGWIFRGFAQLDGIPTEFVYVPPEILGLLPRRAASPFASAEAPAPITFSDPRDALAVDATTLLAHVQTAGLRRERAGWAGADLQQLNRQLLCPDPAPATPIPSGRLALLLHFLEKLGWSASTSRGEQHLNASAVRQWLQLERARQWQTLWVAWLEDESWDDLRLLPELVCEGGWRNDPPGTRRRLLTWLGQAEAGRWHTIAGWISALKMTAPDFLRPTGDYDSWYIRYNGSETYLRGFAHWDDIEGRLARYLITGPLHWLGVVALDAASERMTVTAAGRSLLRGEAPPCPRPGDLVVKPDFAILVPTTASSFDRFRVARFAAWESSPRLGSDEPFRYRITRRSLLHAEAQGLTAERALAFLRERVGDRLPENVARALARWSRRDHSTTMRSSREHSL